MIYNGANGDNDPGILKNGSIAVFVHIADSSLAERCTLYLVCSITPLAPPAVSNWLERPTCI